MEVIGKTESFELGFRGASLLNGSLGLESVVLWEIISALNEVGGKESRSLLGILTTST